MVQKEVQLEIQEEVKWSIQWAEQVIDALHLLAQTDCFCHLSVVCVLASIMGRTRGCEIDEQTLCRLLDEHVTVATCGPKDLFAFKRSSKWAAVKAHAELLSGILTATDGRVMRQVKFHESLRRWLLSKQKEWSVGDSERAAYDLRCMLMALRSRKRNMGKAPSRYPSLAVLLDKVQSQMSCGMYVVHSGTPLLPQGPGGGVGGGP